MCRLFLHFVYNFRNLRLCDLLSVIIVAKAHNIADFLLEYHSELAVTNLLIRIQLSDQCGFVDVIGNRNGELCTFTQLYYTADIFGRNITVLLTEFRLCDKPY